MEFSTILQLVGFGVMGYSAFLYMYQDGYIPQQIARPIPGIKPWKNTTGYKEGSYIIY